MSEESKNILPPTTPQETIMDIGALVASIVPWVGGPINSVLAGITLTRKIDRVREVLLSMSEQIKNLQSDVSEQYVKTDDFQELCEKTLKQVADERNENKRQIYAAFLSNDIKSPGKPYDEKIRILKTLEDIQFDHVRMLNALVQPPDSTITNISGSVGQTLQKRLPDIPRNKISDLAQQLTDMRLANITNLNVMMTARGAEELNQLITRYGSTFMNYIRISD